MKSETFFIAFSIKQHRELRCLCDEMSRYEKQQPSIHDHLHCYVRSEFSRNFKLSIYRKMRIAKPNDIFVSIEVSFACVNSLYTSKSAWTQSQIFGYSVFASEPDHAAWIRYSTENKAELTYSDFGFQIQTFCYVKIVKSPSLNRSLIETTHWHLRIWAQFSKLYYATSLVDSWTGELLKVIKHHFYIFCLDSVREMITKPVRSILYV